MFGPEYNTKGSPTYLTNNRIPKGNGGHHLNDSTITDDGNNVVFTTPIAGTAISASSGFLGNLTGTASNATSASHALNADNAISSSFATNSNTSISASFATTATSASHALNTDNAISASYALTASFLEGGVPVPSLQEVTSVGASTSASISITDGGNLMVDNQNGNADLVVTNDGSNTYSSTIRLGGGTAGGGNGFYLEMLPGDIANLRSDGGVITFGNNVQVTGSLDVNGGITGSLEGTASYALQALSASFAPSSPAFPFTGNAQINGNLSVTGSYLRLSGSFSGSLIDNITDTFTGSAPIEHVVSLTQAEYNTISGSADPNTLYYITDAASFVTSASFATTAATASFVAGVALLGSINTFTANNVFSGSVRGEVRPLSIGSNTASLDCSSDNFYTLQLVSGSNTFINPSNILPGQTINLRINTTGSATVSFPSSVLQQSGSSYVPTTTTGVDVVTFISFDATSLLLSNVKNLV
jgi:hypothetical protein